jgi:hypothetical protein
MPWAPQFSHKDKLNKPFIIIPLGRLLGIDQNDSTRDDMIIGGSEANFLFSTK